MSKNTLIDQAQSRSLAIENDLNARGLLENLQDRFGNKYKLEFGDDYGNFKYRVLIQQRGYTGAILPMIGTNDPVVLQWEGDDDFYEPIKGSQCIINLMVTDSVTYDNFYDYPERTYKVLLQCTDMMGRHRQMDHRLGTPFGLGGLSRIHLRNL